MPPLTIPLHSGDGRTRPYARRSSVRSRRSSPLGRWENHRSDLCGRHRTLPSTHCDCHIFFNLLMYICVIMLSIMKFLKLVMHWSMQTQSGGPMPRKPLGLDTCSLCVCQLIRLVGKMKGLERRTLPSNFILSQNLM